jgi:hypothetical protein
VGFGQGSSHCTMCLGSTESTVSLFIKFPFDNKTKKVRRKIEPSEIKVELGIKKIARRNIGRKRAEKITGARGLISDDGSFVFGHIVWAIDHVRNSAKALWLALSTKISS